MQLTTEQLKALIKDRVSSSGLELDCSSDGSILSTIAVIAEAPGHSEVAARRPLVGGAGTLLWNKLRKEGITKDQCYVTNVCKRQLLFSDDTKMKISPHERSIWIDLLNWELCMLPNLRYVLVLGNLALEALTGHSGVLNWRGSVLPKKLVAYDTNERIERDVTIIVANNPAFCLREPKTEVSFAFDLHKLRRVIDGLHRPTTFSEHINPSFDAAREWLHRMRTEHEPVSFDIELLGTETACFGSANGPSEAMCISFKSLDGSVYTSSEEDRLRRDIQDLLVDPEVRLIAQNGAFDCGWLGFKDRMKVKPLWLDTMLAHHTLYPALPHNLGFLTTQYTDNPYYKDEKNNWKEIKDINAFWRYNCHDCCNTWQVAMRELEELRAQGLDEFFFSHVMRAQSHLINMTLRGLKVDTELKSKLIDELEIDLQTKLSAFYDAVHEATGDDEYNPLPTSPKQMSELFFNKLKLVGRGVSTDKINRELMRKHPRTSEAAKKVIDTLDAYAKEQKFFSTYAKARIDVDGRIRCEWKQTGVQSAPGRLSSAETSWSTGMNMQNQPDRAMSMYIADESDDPDDPYVFFYFDLSQAEARAVGWLAGIDSWIEQFERARVDGQYDCHRALASEMFSIPYDEVPTKDRDGDGKPTIRYISKRCRHGLNYRMGPDRLSLVTGLSAAEASHAYDLYHRLTPELKRWWNETEQEFRSTKRLYSPLGRRMLLMERVDPKALESIVAFKPQSLVGDWVTSVIYRTADRADWPSQCWWLLNIHDALIGLGKRSQAHAALRIVIEEAEKPIMINGREMIIPIEPGISQPGEDGVHRISTIKKVKRGDLYDVHA